MTDCTGQFADTKTSNPICLRCGRDRFDHIELEETAAVVEEGNPGMTRSEAERLARQWQQDRQRLPLVTPGQTPRSTR